MVVKQNQNIKSKDRSAIELVDLKEHLTGNMSSQKLHAIMVHFLNPAISAIARSTNLYKRESALLLELVIRDNRRKVSSITGQALYDKLFTSVVSNHATHSRIMCTLNLERSIHHEIIDSFLRETEDLIEIEKDSVVYKNSKAAYRFLEISNDLGGDITLLSAARYWTLEFYKNYLKFKEYIIQKYVRHSFNESRKAGTGNSSMLIDLEDSFSNHLMSANKAIDKFDPDRGVLTGYINKWNQQAKSNPDFGHEYGLAYVIPPEERKRQLDARTSGNSNAGNFYQVIDDTHLEIPDETEAVDQQEDYTAKNSRIAIKAKKAKYAFLAFGLPYTLNEEEIQLLASTVKK